MNEPRWDDERLTAAFRDAFGRRPPANLAAAAACAVRAAPQRREAAPWRRIATAAAVVVLAVALTLYSPLLSMMNQIQTRPRF